MRGPGGRFLTKAEKEAYIAEQEERERKEVEQQNGVKSGQCFFCKERFFCEPSENFRHHGLSGRPTHLPLALALTCGRVKSTDLYPVFAEYISRAYSVALFCEVTPLFPQV
jgi:hypothetical protein